MTALSGPLQQLLALAFGELATVAEHKQCLPVTGCSGARKNLPSCVIFGVSLFFHSVKKIFTFWVLLPSSRPPFKGW
jgi:hypothetical protein